jgi:hypothetical protein
MEPCFSLTINQYQHQYQPKIQPADQSCCRWEVMHGTAAGYSGLPTATMFHLSKHVCTHFRLCSLFVLIVGHRAGPARHGPMATGPRRHATPCRPCLTGLRAWPSAQTRACGPIFMPCWPVRHGKNCGPCQPITRFTKNISKRNLYLKPKFSTRNLPTHFYQLWTIILSTFRVIC